MTLVCSNFLIIKKLHYRIFATEQVLRTESVYVGGLGFGLTSCDPNRISPRELPEDSDLLIDRPEYWVVSKDVANTPHQGDELSFMVNYNGKQVYVRSLSVRNTYLYQFHFSIGVQNRNHLFLLFILLELE